MRTFILHYMHQLDDGCNLVPLTSLRRRLAPHGDRAAQDEAIRDMRVSGILSAVAIEGRHGTTAEEREACIVEGDALLGYLARR